MQDDAQLLLKNTNDERGLYARPPRLQKEKLSGTERMWWCNVQCVCVCSNVGVLDYVDNLLDVFLGDRVGADDATVVGLVDLLLRALHVHNVHRVVMRL